MVAMEICDLTGVVFFIIILPLVLLGFLILALLGGVVVCPGVQRKYLNKLYT